MFSKLRRQLSSAAWGDLLKLLQLYADDVIGEADLGALVTSCCGQHVDSAAAFLQLLARCAARRAAAPSSAAPMCLWLCARGHAGVSGPICCQHRLCRGASFSPLCALISMSISNSDDPGDHDTAR